MSGVVPSDPQPDQPYPSDAAGWDAATSNVGPSGRRPRHRMWFTSVFWLGFAFVFALVGIVSYSVVAMQGTRVINAALPFRDTMTTRFDIDDSHVVWVSVEQSASCEVTDPFGELLEVRSPGRYRSEEMLTPVALFTTNAAGPFSITCSGQESAVFHVTAEPPSAWAYWVGPAVAVLGVAVCLLRARATARQTA